jgi:hypothetical protein
MEDLVRAMYFDMEAITEFVRTSWRGSRI